MVLSGSSAASRQPPLGEQYQSLVNSYAGGAFAASVVALLKLHAEDVNKEAVEALQQQARDYERSAVSKPDLSPREADAGRVHRRRLRAVAAMHLEAAIAVPPDAYTTRQTHLSISEAALRGLNVTRNTPWSRHGEEDAAVRADVASFRRDWLLIAATHSQRAGFLEDALGFVKRALDEFGDQAVFHVVEGSILEVLGSPIATFDSARIAAGLSPSDSQSARIALQRAARSYGRALELQPGDAESRVRAARVYVLLGSVDAAKTHLSDEAPSGRLAYLLALVRGQAAEAQGDYDDAIGHYRRAVSFSNGWQSACIALAHALVRAGRQQEARDGLRTCVSRQPGASDPWPAYAMGLEWLVAPTVRQLRLRVGEGPGAKRD